MNPEVSGNIDRNNQRHPRVFILRTPFRADYRKGACRLHFRRQDCGLSKLNRAVNYFSKRPQVQERLTLEIAAFLKTKLRTQDVAVVIEAEHLCVASRGIRHTGSLTFTASYGGAFEKDRKDELLKLLTL